MKKLLIITFIGAVLGGFVGRYLGESGDFGMIVGIIWGSALTAIVLRERKEEDRMKIDGSMIIDGPTMERAKNILNDMPEMNFGDPDAQVVAKIAKRVGVPMIFFQPDQKLIRFGDATMFIDVWYSKMTVATNVQHPTKGWNRLYRKHVSLEELEKIMAYPRQHTGKGYRTKK